MANLTVENLAGSLKSGQADSLLTNDLPAVSAPEAPALRAMQSEGMALPQESSGESVKGFGQMLIDSLEKVNSAQKEADHSIRQLAAGRTKNIHETMLAIEKADTSLKLMMQVRNKVLEAYKEIIRMQV